MTALEKIKKKIKDMMDTRSDKLVDGAYFQYKELLEYVEEVEKDIPKSLEDAALYHRRHGLYGGDINLAMQESFKEGARWQRLSNPLQRKRRNSYGKEK